MFREKYPTAWMFHSNTSIEPYQQFDLSSDVVVPHFKEYAGVPVVPLPKPGKLKISLEATLRGRFSCRRFQDRTISLDSVSTLLQASYGIYGQALLGDYELLTRPAPSAGGLYSLEVYVLVRRVKDLERGTYHYMPLDHTLEHLDSESLPTARLTELFLGQTYASDAALLAVITAVLAPPLGKYGDRGYRLLLLEAGHVMQNLNLAATALRLGSVNLAGFFDADLGMLLDLNSNLEVPIYASAIGKPRRADVDFLRQP
jgi:SagB-type dehydrogenase family enzyme